LANSIIARAALDRASMSRAFSPFDLDDKAS
jgi:hypothetical protein